MRIEKTSWAPIKILIKPHSGLLSEIHLWKITLKIRATTNTLPDTLSILPNWDVRNTTCGFRVESLRYLRAHNAQIKY